MRTHGQFHWTIGIAASMICIFVTIAPVSAKSKVNDQNVTAVSGTVTGNVQEVGFRAMIQKQAIRYNLAGSAENNTDGSVRFTLQGDNDQKIENLLALDSLPTNLLDPSKPPSADNPSRTEP